MNAAIRIGFVFIWLFATTAVAQENLKRAVDLYESAAYEEALAELGRLKTEATGNAVAEIDHYRALCLMALNRSAEAERVIESLVNTDPLYQPDAAGASPRVRASFNAVRQRVLPGVARQLYIDAKALFDRKVYAEAATALERTVKVIDDVEATQKSDLTDLRLLAAGFLELARASAPRPPAKTEAVGALAPSNQRNQAEPAVTLLPATTNLVVLKQDLPPLPFSLSAAGKQEYRGVLELEIDVNGRVSDVKIVQPVHVLYDILLLQAAREWTYEAPRVAGKPIVSRKRVEIVLRP
jgi:tetratricopeptide (TPR) repeat protein